MDVITPEYRALLAEGPVWHEGMLWYVDIQRGALCRVGLDGSGFEWRALVELLGAASPCDDGRWLLAYEDGLMLYDWDRDEREVVSDVLRDVPFRMNDGKADPRGRFWVGTIATERGAGSASFYCYEHGRGIATHLTGVTISNGLDWSADGSRMYYIDTPTKRVDVFDFDMERGAISNRQPLVVFGEDAGGPDGMCLDADGHAWVAFWGGSCVRCFDGETGEQLREVAVPAERVTSCCFAGEGLDRLVITTASAGLRDDELEAQPGAGRVFVTDVGVRGRAGHAVRLNTSR
ncbi:SMP-30/gluconolactonase/LRE family protein [Mucisphaera calidilacus]|nr:SMP-30/gluconolactonase/LRE family protein [Mucisphaera calidilacus]